MNITFQGNPVTLSGTPLKAGDQLPDFTLRGTDLADFTKKDLKGVSVLITVPSLDTPVCDLEIKRFNNEVAKLGTASVYAISLDLPFAQQRWCGANGVNAIKPLSGYACPSFAEATGTLINGIHLYTRAVFVINSDGTVAYAQYVPEVTAQPDFEAVYQAVSAAK